MKPIILGLTGSIAMGKSTIGAMLVNLGIPVHDSDKAVHALLEKDSAAYPLITEAFPYYEHPRIYDIKTRSINRKKLGSLVFACEDLREMLESILHPLVQQSQHDFITQHTRLGSPVVCLDIPLLFETEAQKRVDYTLVVSAPYALQRQRALERPGMDEQKLAAILSRQLSDREKCKRADYVIKTGLGRACSMKMLARALLDIRIRAGLIPNPEEKETEQENSHYA